MKISKNAVKNLKLALYLIGSFTILATLIPYLEIEHWSIRVFDFPILLLTVLTFGILLCLIPFFNYKRLWSCLFSLILIACLVLQMYKILPYTRLGTLEVMDASKKPNPTVSIYTANVMQKNDSVQSVIDDSKNFGADILLFTETNTKWTTFLNERLTDNYPYSVQVPQDNTYGMILYSKFALADSSIKFLVEDSIPSIHTQVRLPSNQIIQIYAIHPSPPTPLHNPKSLDRDAELIKIGRLSKNTKIPVVVLGDFNDVAWSATTQLFQSYSGLLDLRKGRGLYNTYHAKYWFTRWPLDHVFVSPHFGVLDVQLGKNVGSDHFPFYTELSLEPELTRIQKLPEPKIETIKKANEQIKEEKLDDS